MYLNSERFILIKISSNPKMLWTNELWPYALTIRCYVFSKKSVRMASFLLNYLIVRFLELNHVLN